MTKTELKDYKTADKNFARKMLAALRRIWIFFGGRMLFGLVSAVICMFLLRWLAEEIYEGETFRFDEIVRSNVHNFASPLMTGLMTTLSIIGSTTWLFIQGAFLCAIFAYFRLRHSLIIFLLTMSGTILLIITLKNIFQRQRPEPFFDIQAPTSFSFPSGHALSALCFYAVTAWLLTWRTKNRALRAVVWAVAVLLIAGIGFSRIYLGVHYPSDVLAGYAAAFIWLTTIFLGDFIYHKHYETLSVTDSALEADGADAEIAAKKFSN